MLYTGLFLGSISGAGAEGLKNKHFLELTDNQKKAWINAMIDTLGFVAGYQDIEQTKCIWNWYYKDERNKNGLIIGYMEKYPDKAPPLLLITLTEKACGSYATLKKV